MPLNSIPYEVLGAPAEAYVAATGAAFPDIDGTPNPAVWTRLGTDGALNITTDGISANHPQSISDFRSLGAAGVRKRFLTEEDGRYMLTVADLTMEQYAQAIGNTVTDVPSGAGAAGSRWVGLSRPATIPTVALLIRVLESPYVEDGYMQYEIPYAQQVGQANPIFRRDQPALLQFEFGALIDPNAATEAERLGRVRAQDTEATS